MDFPINSMVDLSHELRKRLPEAIQAIHVEVLANWVLKKGIEKGLLKFETSNQWLLTIINHH